MITAIPKSFYAAHPSETLEDNFVHNSKRLTTSVDMFWTDLGIIGGQKGFSEEAQPYGWLRD
jgi:hypothetical protein